MFRVHRGTWLILIIGAVGACTSSGEGWEDLVTITDRPTDGPGMEEFPFAESIDARQIVLEDEALEDLHHLKRLVHLEKVVLYLTEPINLAPLSEVARLRTVELVLDGINSAELDLSRLASLPALETLELKQADAASVLSPALLTELRAARTLSRLVLNGDLRAFFGVAGDQQGVTALNGLTQLTDLELVQVSHPTSNELEENVPEGSLGSDWKADLSGLDGLERLSRLRIIRLPLTDLRFVTTLPRLRSLRISGAEFGGSLAPLAAHGEWDYLDLTVPSGMSDEPLPTMRVWQLVIYGDHSDLSFLRQVRGVRSVVLNLPHLRDLQAPPSLKTSVRDLVLGRALTRNLRPLQDLTSLTELTIRDMNVDAWPSLPGLRELSLFDASIQDPEPPPMPRLRKVYAARTTFRNFSGFVSHGPLREVDLDSSRVDSLSGLEGRPLVKLRLAEVRDLAGNLWGDFGFLQQTPAIADLELGPLTTLAPLAGLHHVRSLRVHARDGDSPFKAELRFLSQMRGLRKLTLQADEVTDVDALFGLTLLEELHITTPSIEHADFVVVLRRLRRLTLPRVEAALPDRIVVPPSLRHLSLARTRPKDVPFVATLTELRTLDLGAAEEVVDVSALAQMADLRMLDMSGTSVPRLEALHGNTALRWIRVNDRLEPGQMLAIGRAIPSLSIQLDGINSMPSWGQFESQYTSGGRDKTTFYPGELMFEVMAAVEADYLDPTRLVPAAMLVAAAERLADSMATVSILSDAVSASHTQDLELAVDGHAITFALSELRSLQDLTAALWLLYSEITTHDTGTDPLFVEALAMDGILRSLDPYSRLSGGLLAETTSPAGPGTRVRRLVPEGVFSHHMGAGIAYLGISGFERGTRDAVAAALRRVEARVGSLRGLVLDLRQNGGGKSRAATQVMDLLMDARVVSAEFDRLMNERPERTKTTSGDPWEELPLVVLIDDQTASAAEVIAAAVRDTERGLLIGTRSFGKAVGQLIGDLGVGDLGMKLTSTLNLSADGSTWQGVGLTPDIDINPVLIDAPDDFSIVPVSAIPRPLKPWLHVPQRLRPTVHEPIRGDLLATEATEFTPGVRLDETALLAAAILRKAKSPQRAELISLGRALYEKRKHAESRSISYVLARHRVDWSAGSPPTPASRLAVRVVTEPPSSRGGDDDVAAVRFTARVENLGPDTAFQVTVRLISEHLQVDGRQIPLGKIPPGQTRTFGVDLWLGDGGVPEFDAQLYVAGTRLEGQTGDVASEPGAVFATK